MATGCDLRLDLFPGLALWLTFLDHVPTNVVNWPTIWNYGFSDATEIFIFASGHAAAFVNGRSMRARCSARTSSSALRAHLPSAIMPEAWRDTRDGDSGCDRFVRSAGAGARFARLPHPQPLAVRGQRTRSAVERIAAVGTASSMLPGCDGAPNAYPARLEAALKRSLQGLGVTVVNHAEPRQSSSQISDFIDKILLHDKPSLVIWQA